MTIARVQTGYGSATTLGTSTTATWDDGAPTEGNELHLFLALEKSVTDLAYPVLPDGWTQRHHVYEGICYTHATKTAGPAEPATVTCTHANITDRTLVLVEVSGGVYAGGATAHHPTDTTPDLPAVAPAAGIEVLLLAGQTTRLAYNLNSGPSGYTTERNENVGELRSALFSRHVDPTSGGSYGGTATMAHWVASVAIHVWLTEVLVAPVAEFSATPTAGVAPMVVEFTDESTGDPDTWAWAFGDGGTSTAQDPDHTYSTPGIYAVTLTVENATGEDSITKSAYITVTLEVGYVPPSPSIPLLEIYAQAPGAAKWGIAKWGVDTWSSAGWRDVTPYGVTVNVRWGSTRPEFGILSVPVPDVWAIDTYDPGRTLDPANAAGPYFGDLKAGMRLRVNHRGVTVRTGIVESIGYSHRERGGYIRATNKQSTLANADVPPDTTLADTLFARARAAISAAGLAVTVLPDPPGGDPDLVAWVTGTSRKAWAWIADAAQQVLYVPYFDEHDRLGFRPWSSPLARGRAFGSDELVDLQDIASHAGRYSVVQVRDDTGGGGAIIERALTPTPSYGTPTYLRDDPTPNAADWADAVLADRSLGSLRWVPGDLYPSTAEAVERMASMQAIELVTLSVDEAVPPVVVSAIIVGGSFRARGRLPDRADWRFEFETAETPLEPLVVSSSDPPEYLLATGGGQYLYPSSGG